MNPISAKLLIVDDQRQARQLIGTLMRNLGVVNIDEAPDGQSALEHLQRKPYDLVLADWNMPFLNGIELVRIIRRMPALKGAPVVLISCEVSAQRRVEALEAGVSGLVAKPFVNETLCKKVMAILSSLAPVTESA